MKDKKQQSKEIDFIQAIVIGRVPQDQSVSLQNGFALVF